MDILTIPIEALRPYGKNAKEHTAEQIASVANSIKEFGWRQPIVIDKNNIVVIGHCRLQAAKTLGYKDVPCLRADDLTEEQIKALRLADNKTNESIWNFDILQEELGDIVDFDMQDFGFAPPTDDIAERYSDRTPGALKAKFIMPPFSVLDARQGDWQKRKKAWLKIIDSGNGRDDSLLGKGLLELARDTQRNITGTSIFDPVLAEVLINWFSPRNGSIIDPFAGGSVRGLVSSFLEREYHGNDLSNKQIKANLDNFVRIEGSTTFFDNRLECPTWTHGDSRDIDSIIERDNFDMLLTCPPYGDLEVYSTDPADISNMPYDEFMIAYRDILSKSIAKLKDNAFIVIVVGEIRDNKGYYRNFIGDTIQAVEATGAKYYNEIILITMGGTLALRAGKAFDAARKVGNTHQKALIFLNSKGDNDALNEYVTEFDSKKILTPMKKSILVFLRGNAKLAKGDLERYEFEIF